MLGKFHVRDFFQERMPTMVPARNDCDSLLHDQIHKHPSKDPGNEVGDCPKSSWVSGFFHSILLLIATDFSTLYYYRM